jgi:hypothetical protein
MAAPLRAVGFNDILVCDSTQEPNGPLVSFRRPLHNAFGIRLDLQTKEVTIDSVEP